MVRTQVVRGFGSDDPCGSFESEVKRELPQQRRLYAVSVMVGNYEKDGRGNPGMMNGENLVQ